jgi:hypothetical protein
MKFELKPLHKNTVPAALDKAERYRLLNEPGQAESICLDVLLIDPAHQRALVTLLLALTDQFDKGPAAYVNRAREVVALLNDEYERAYYSGIICERRATAQLKMGAPGSGAVAYNWFREAMEYYEKAEALRPPENDDPVLRWNTCARRIMANADLRPVAHETAEPVLE